MTVNNNLIPKIEGITGYSLTGMSAVRLLPGSECFKVINPMNNTLYPIKETPVIFRNLTERCLHLFIETAQKTEMGRSKIQQPCFQYTADLFSKELFEVTFVHTCDFSLKIMKDNEEMPEKNLQMGQKNQISFKEPEKAPEPKCVIL